MACNLCGLGRGGCSRRFPSQLEKRAGDLWELAEASLRDCMAMGWRPWIKKEVPPILHSPVLLPLAQGSMLSWSSIVPRWMENAPSWTKAPFCWLPVKAPVWGLLKRLGRYSPTSGPELNPSESSFPPAPPHSVFSKIRDYFSLPVTPTTCLVDGGGNRIIIIFFK